MFFLFLLKTLIVGRQFYKRVPTIYVLGQNKKIMYKNIKISSFKSSENIQKKEGGPDRSVSNN